MWRAVISLLLLLPLAGCGVLIPYMYDAQKLQEQLAVSMPKEQVLKHLGKPDRVIQDDGVHTIWEYRLYPKGEWAGYLVHCPLFPNCYFPAEAASPYYVVLQDNQVCIWGTPNIVRPLIRIACGMDVRPETKYQVKRGFRISVIPVFMPPPITPLPQRLAVVPISGSVDNEVTSWVDLTLSFLRTRHRELILVEREDLGEVLNEVGIQYAEQADDDTTIRLGKLVGADSLLTYRLLLPEDNSLVAASFELRLFEVESGTTVFRQTASANHTPSETETATQRLYKSGPLARRLVLEEAAAYGLAALTAAFGDNPLGVVSNYSWTGEGLKLIDVLQGGPAFRAGLKPGDQILESNGRSLRGWAAPVSLPAHLTVRRDGVPLEISVR
ncbi:PDZ domain-containing protein [Petrachloros mirabilis]